MDGSDKSRQEQDRLSQLPDDVLVLVLERLRPDVRLIARTSILSKRWRTLPLMLSRLEITVPSFLPADYHSSTSSSARRKLGCLHEATAKLTDALRFFLATRPAGGGSQYQSIETLKLRFPLTKRHRRLHEIGRLVSAAAARGEVRRLEVMLDTLDVTRDDDGAARARGYARRFMRLFRAAPAGGAVLLGSCLKKLVLHNLCFRRASELEGVVAECGALETLHLNLCRWWWSGAGDLLRIDAPRLRELRLVECGITLVVVRAPELVSLWCQAWSSGEELESPPQPVTFAQPASAPSLKHMTLINRAWSRRRFKLSDLLRNTNPLENLCLDFCTGNIWVEPACPTNLGAAFSKLKKLYVRRVSPQVDLAWTMFLLKAAPLLELLDIHVSYHPFCCFHKADDDLDLDEWEAPPLDRFEHFEHRHLQAFKIRGGIDAEGDLSFVKLVMERAVDLKLLLLNAKVTCETCIAAAKQQDPSTVVSKFPGDKDGVDAFVRQLRDGMATTARIIVFSSAAQIFEC